MNPFEKLLKRLALAIVSLTSLSVCQQININRIELMPNLPEPYLMRNWKEVALGYDSLVFNHNLQGNYLPLVWENASTTNYPGHNSFGLHTVVGTGSPLSAEAINCLPAVVGASLVGIDKTSQDGYNYVLMCEEWFNKRPEQNIYKNHPVDDTNNDWWYETMPNVFFYQLYDLHRSTGDFDAQFITVADRFLESVVAMNGSTTPWRTPYMNYRGWDFSNMTPYDSGVREPEAAGVIAWILYNAFVETGDEKYRIGAEWCLEYLNDLMSNPSYELQLPYGVYTAARMNMEIGTDYNISRMLSWCFDVGNLRNWGCIIGNWGGYDVHGLIGEVNGSNDYAFSMNTMEHIGALLPIARYDTRYARALGKWVLNAANALRFFYPAYLPDNKQDSEEWSHQYDPNSYIAHEAMRQEKYSVQPYATGDAIDGGWGETNLTLYSSSHVGILGSIIDTTNVEGILKLDLNATDYFNGSAYPSYLYYNPYSTDETVNMTLEPGSYDLYDVASNSMIANAVSGSYNLHVPADGVLVVVLIPSGAQVILENEKSIVNNVIIDYDNGSAVNNYPPRIKSLSTSTNNILQGETANLYCTVHDKENSTINYYWYSDSGTFQGEGSSVTWTAPSLSGTYSIQCIVQDAGGKNDTAEVSIEVSEFINHSPVIDRINAIPRKVDINEQTVIECSAHDVDNDTLVYNYFFGEIPLESEGNVAQWDVPGIEGDYCIRCEVTDPRNSTVRDSIKIRVRDFSNDQTGSLIGYYPFTGNANDLSGNAQNGTVFGATLTSDRFSNPNSAYKFDGLNDRIQVTNSSVLNFQEAISICFWMKVGKIYERESFLISHGSWENRWKISISNNKLRWTIKTTQGVVDLDSETTIEENVLYHVTVLYSGDDIELYINGKLDSFGYYNGGLLTTNYDLTMGQMLPGNTSYNYNGVLDEVRIYDYALGYETIQELQDVSTSIEDEAESEIPNQYLLKQNYPNPFNSCTNIKFSVFDKGRANIEIYDITGRKITTLIDSYITPGEYKVSWNGENSQGVSVTSGVYFCKMNLNTKTQIKKIVLLK